MLIEYSSIDLANFNHDIFLKIKFLINKLINLIIKNVDS